MKKLYFILFSFLISASAFAKPMIYVNQIAFDSYSPKFGVVQFDSKLAKACSFNLIATSTGKIAFTGMLSQPQTITDWAPGKLFFQADFSEFNTAGKYRLRLKVDGVVYTSYPFIIGEQAVARQTISSIIHYYNKQRANTPGELAADAKMQLFGSDKKGICGAAGAMPPAM